MLHIIEIKVFQLPGQSIVSKKVYMKIVQSLIETMQMLLDGSIETQEFEDCLYKLRVSNPSIQFKNLYHDAINSTNPQRTDTEKDIHNILTVLNRSDDDVTAQITKAREVGNTVLADCYESLFKYSKDNIN